MLRTRLYNDFGCKHGRQTIGDQSGGEGVNWETINALQERDYGLNSGVRVQIRRMVC